MKLRPSLLTVLLLMASSSAPAFCEVTCLTALSPVKPILSSKTELIIQYHCVSVAWR